MIITGIQFFFCMPQDEKYLKPAEDFGCLHITLQLSSQTFIINNIPPCANMSCYVKYNFLNCTSLN